MANNEKKILTPGQVEQTQGSMVQNPSTQNMQVPTKQTDAMKGTKAYFTGGQWVDPNAKSVMADNTGNGQNNNPVQWVDQNAPTTRNGMNGVRNSLISRGISNDRIGWNDKTGMITIDGVDMFRPSEITKGVSYGKDSDINNATKFAYENTGEQVLKGKQYIEDTLGVSNAVKWNAQDGTFDFGGQTIKPLYVSPDGIAYVQKSVLDNAIAQYKQTTGFDTVQNALNSWKNTYGRDIRDKQNKVDNFSYNPNFDPEYRRYAENEMRKRQGLAEDAAARANAQMGTYSAVNAGAIADSLFKSQQDIADAIPEFSDRAYKRAQNDLENARNIGADMFGREMEVNQEGYNRQQKVNQDDYDRYKDFRDMAYEDNVRANEITRDNMYTERYGEILGNEIAQNYEKLRGARLNNDAQQSALAVTIAQFGGKINGNLADGIYVEFADRAGRTRRVTLAELLSDDYEGFDPFRTVYMQNYKSQQGVNNANYENAMRQMGL